MIFKGPFMLFGHIVYDTYSFIISLYQKNLKPSNEKLYNKLEDVSLLDRKYFEIMRKILYKHRNKLIDMKKARNFLINLDYQ
jgi:hypothetical protein